MKIKNEIIAKIILKQLNKILNSDIADTWHYIQLVLENQDEITTQLSNNSWKISNKFNAQNRTKRYVGFVLTEEDEDGIEEFKMVHTYIIDGRGYKRVATKSWDCNWVEYKHVDFEEIKKEVESLKKECQCLLPETSYTEIECLEKDKFDDYSPKCYKYNDSVFPNFTTNFSQNLLLNLKMIKY